MEELLNAKKQLYSSYLKMMNDESFDKLTESDLKLVDLLMNDNQMIEMFEKAKTKS